MPLCSDCAALGINPARFRDVSSSTVMKTPDERKIPKKIRLGSFEDIGSRSTRALCQSILHCLIPTRSSDNAATYEIELDQLPPISNPRTTCTLCPLFLFLSSIIDSSSCRIYFAPAATGSTVPGSCFEQYFGRRLYGQVEQSRLVRHWLVTCETCHSMTCASLIRRTTDVHNMLFVDVSEQCIVTGSTHSRYIALSYVWGDLPSFLLLGHNLEPSEASWKPCGAN